MSRLDSFLRRITAQRDCLNHVAALVAGMDGVVLELGLGNGRTFDHLREVLPGHEIFVFDKQVAAHPDCIPDAEHMIVGGFLDTLPAALPRLGGRAVLAHCDVGSGDAAANARLATVLGAALNPLMRPGAIVLSDQAIGVAGWRPLALPPGVRPGRYHIWQIPG